MKNIIIKAAVFTAIFYCPTFSLQAAPYRFADSGGSLECSADEQCFGINASLTCSNGAKCYNFGTQKPKCKDKKSICVKLPLPSPACEWDQKGKVVAEKSLKCNLQQMRIIQQVQSINE